jgi:hypothetical protein
VVCAGSDTSVLVYVPRLTLAYGSVTVRYLAVVWSAAFTAESLPTNASLVWDSSPLTVTAGSVVNVGRPRASWSATSLLVGQPSLLSGPVLFSTSIPETPGALVSVGETVTYQLTIQLREGVSPTTVIVANLSSAGLVLQYVSSRVFAVGGQLANPSALSSTSATVSDLARSDGILDHLVWDFGAVTNAPDGVVDSGDQLTVEWTGVVADVAANTNTTVSGSSGTGLGKFEWSVSSAENAAPLVSVVEPWLQVSLVSNISLPADAGDVILYTMVVAHTMESTSAAFDLNITDVLHSDLELVVGSVGWSGSGQLAAAVLVGNVGESAVCVCVCTCACCCCVRPACGPGCCCFWLRLRGPCLLCTRRVWHRVWCGVC